MDFPRFGLVRQLWPDSPAPWPDKWVRAALEQEPLLEPVAPGDSVLITASSRGIQAKAEVLAALVRAVRARGGRPLILPAMGSHGGGTAQGQVSLLAGHGHHRGKRGRAHRGEHGRGGDRDQRDRLAGAGGPVRGGGQAHPPGQPGVRGDRVDRTHRIRAAEDERGRPGPPPGGRGHAPPGPQDLPAKGHPSRGPGHPGAAAHPGRGGPAGGLAGLSAAGGGGAGKADLRAGARAAERGPAVSAQVAL